MNELHQIILANINDNTPPKKIITLYTPYGTTEYIPDKSHLNRGERPKVVLIDELDDELVGMSMWENQR